MRTLRRTALLLGLVRPGADASTLVVYESIRTHDHVVLAVHTEVELVTDAGVVVREVAVLPGTVRRGLGRL